mmetsp:Transcript_13968/g.32898  ORF Transcript_13968/g.32898 Transcript_13968/m.32898 type:complete len:282 (-) Transcript_13968:55-900(-)
MSGTPSKGLIEVAPGFYNVRAHFYVLAGMIDIGTHMSLCRLQNGKFLVLDAIKPVPALKKEIDQLTNGGELIDAVIATHPFHSLYFKDFYAAYPNTRYFGTPRHIKMIKDIPWAGETMESKGQWEPEIEMRIPAGSEYVDPKPPKSNHFCNVVVFHKASRTIFNDDNLMVFNDPGFLLRMFGIKDGDVIFHPSIKGPGLNPTPEAPLEYKKWILQMLIDWDFDNLVTAHNGNQIGGAKQKIEALLNKSEKLFAKIRKQNCDKAGKKDCGAWGDDKDGHECG